MADPVESADIDPHAERHADAGGAEAPMPRVGWIKAPAYQDFFEARVLREVAGHQRRREGTDVDPHVEEREAGIAACVAAGVQSADERADTWLEQAGAHRDEDEAHVEGREGVQYEGVVSGGDDEAADKDRSPRPDEVVGDEPAEDAQHVARHDVVAVDRRGLLLVEAQAAGSHWGDHEKHQQGAHPVVRETLPEFGEEEVTQSLGVAANAPGVHFLWDVGGRIRDREGGLHRAGAIRDRQSPPRQATHLPETLGWR